MLDSRYPAEAWAAEYAAAHPPASRRHFEVLAMASEPGSAAVVRASPDVALEAMRDPRVRRVGRGCLTAGAA